MSEKRCVTHKKYAYHVEVVGELAELDTRSLVFRLRDQRKATIYHLSHPKLCALAKAVTEATKKSYCHTITHENWNITNVLATTLRGKPVYLIYEPNECILWLRCNAEAGSIEDTYRAVIAIAYEGKIHLTKIWTRDSPQTFKLTWTQEARYMIAAIKKNNDPWLEALTDRPDISVDSHII